MQDLGGLTSLPAAYAAALRLRAEGASDSVIAATLDIDEQAVAPLLEIADRKLANAPRASTAPPGDSQQCGTRDGSGG